jgi:tricorn protease
MKHRSDLTYVLDIFGETPLATFVGGGDYPEVNKVEIGVAWRRFVYRNGKYRIKKIYTGESWNSDLSSPLSGPGINIKTGDYYWL